MASAIDPTLPLDNEAAVKGDLRANLSAAKTEIDHGGFSPNSPSNYTTADTKVQSHLTGVDNALGSKSNKSTTINTQAGNYTLALADADAYVRISSASTATLTVPANATVAFPVGAKVYVRQAGAGTLTIAAAGGVTLNTPTTLILSSQHATAALIKVATDAWDLMGDLAGS